MEEREQKDPVQQAVRELRNALGESQQAFATRMKTAIRTVARWETVQRPPLPVLGRLMFLAQESGREDLAQIFAGEFVSGLAIPGPFQMQAVDLWQDVKINTKWKKDVEALLLMLKNPDQCREELAAWAPIRDRVLAMPRNEK